MPMVLRAVVKLSGDACTLSMVFAAMLSRFVHGDSIRTIASPDEAEFDPLAEIGPLS